MGIVLENNGRRKEQKNLRYTSVRFFNIVSNFKGMIYFTHWTTSQSESRKGIIFLPFHPF